MNILSDEQYAGIFSALAEKLKKDGWIPAPGWWMLDHPNASAFWMRLKPEDKIGAWMTAPEDDYVSLVEYLLKRHKEKTNGS